MALIASERHEPQHRIWGNQQVERACGCDGCTSLDDVRHIHEGAGVVHLSMQCTKCGTRWTRILFVN